MTDLICLASPLAPEMTRALPVVGGALAVTGLLLLAVRNAELRRRWRTWCVAAVLLCGTLAFGPPGAAVLAAGLGIVGSLEYVRLVGLRRWDGAVLCTVSLVLPFLAWLLPDRLTFSAAGVLFCLAVLPAVLAQDAAHGAGRAARTVFGLIWLPVALSRLVPLADVAVAVCVAVAFADVGGWCGGRALGRRGPLARRLSALSPAKTWGGLVGSAGLAALALWALGEWTPLRWLAVTCGCAVGDLLESMIKRGAGVKDAGRWLPGFGGLLDRIDSLLVTLLLLGVTL
ncbi:phosphatidate cytidylyltransferase [Streptomyces noursei]|uniref:phosphatidate cytidylyltransferase n=1 Tax=Streptomyces noursei TaxID=1971 RepID=UPI0021557B68|nr:phosphatidate cytidylyltransferase [Streptomyces noursei]